MDTFQLGWGKLRRSSPYVYRSKYKYPAVLIARRGEHKSFSLPSSPLTGHLRRTRDETLTRHERGGSQRYALASMV